MICKPALLLLISITLTTASLSIPTVKVLQGPGSKTTLFGPDGSAVDSAAPGGTVVTDAERPGLVAAGPANLGVSPEVVIGGPAGKVITSYSLAGPAVIRAVAAPVAVAPVPISSGALGSSVLFGDIESHEGQYVPDNTELLYNDGSYKGLH